MEWLSTIDSRTVILVPTRGLQHSIVKEFAQQQIAKGKTAWQTPIILVWEDYIEQLWKKNKHQFETAFTTLDTAQAALIWQSVIKKSKQDNDDLLLLNESQTASAVQRSWALAHKWHVSIQEQSDISDKDAKQFSQWCQSYQQTLAQKQWIDFPQKEKYLVEQTATISLLSENVIFAYFDLLTFSQHQHIDACRKRGVQVELLSTTDAEMPQQSAANMAVFSYQTEQQEWQSVFNQAKQMLEKNPNSSIGIVIPSLASHRRKIEQLARQIFYPNYSPLNSHQHTLAYRFSIGQSLHSIPYIYAMLNSLNLLKNKFSFASLSYLLMSQWWRFRQSNEGNMDRCMQLNAAIKEQRLTWMSWQEALTICEQKLPESESLQEKIRQLIDFKQTHFADNTSVYHSCQKWQSIFTQWLEILGFESPHLDSWHYQAQESWLSVIDSFVSSDLVQANIGLSRALQLINRLCKDKIYMRQAQDEPILISGVLEGIGHRVDHLFVTGMDDAYPPKMPNDPFLDKQQLRQQGYPFADKTLEFNYELNKLQSLFASSQQISISHAKQRDGIEISQSALLSHFQFNDQKVDIKEEQLISEQSLESVDVLEEYSDTLGLECLQSARIKGGSQVFENQSQCPFKAYIEHRILRQKDEDPEFGLDARDSGTLVHELMESLWGSLQSYSNLNRLDDVQLREFIQRHINAYFHQDHPKFQFDRKQLIQLEQQRLSDLLFEWLSFEKENRYRPFTVIGKEKRLQTEFANIPINLVIDRIDQMDTGDCLVIDYKTGNTNYSDWKGERPKSPQLPLYALTLEQQFNQQGEIKGVAVAQVKHQDCQLKGITAIENAGVGLKTELDKGIPWSEQLQLWREILQSLANEFLKGHAEVNPSNANPCQFCDLSSVCRIHQLKSQSVLSVDTDEQEETS